MGCSAQKWSIKISREKRKGKISRPSELLKREKRGTADNRPVTIKDDGKALDRLTHHRAFGIKARVREEPPLGRYAGGRDAKGKEMQPGEESGGSLLAGAGED